MHRVGVMSDEVKLKIKCHTYWNNSSYIKAQWGLLSMENESFGGR